ncbi:siderophore-interacting protein [Microbacterium aoyamense]|uniref:Siderophore-interacting protein n=1 Tax=Microbacterium aoyamense TaxID=344166 RepID=A0ABN2PM18_9MICO|nr:siderophore-interacting protein [Microbacterium aoyamense]
MTNLIHRAEVVRVETLSAGMVRVVLGGEGLAGFVSTGVGDEYLRMWLPRDGEAEPVLPSPSGEQSWAFAEDVEPSPLRTYTVRRWDAARGELSIDMVVHGHGLAARWAETVAPGSLVGVNTPRGMYAAPSDLEWLLMVTDAAGLPAAARILEDLPPGVRVRLYAEVPGPAYEQHIALPSGSELRWVHGGNGHGPSRLEEIVRRSERPDGVGYIWVAGETHSTRGVRRHLRHELGLPTTAYKVVGYWTEDVEQWEARYEALPADVHAHLESLWDDTTRDEEDIEDEYDRTLERFGL